MARIDRLSEGVSFGNCNCDDGCPCQFESLRIHVDRQGLEVFEIANGHFGETSSASSTITGLIAFSLTSSAGQFNRLRQSGGGVVCQ